jgi:hypothetical protein
MTLIPYSEKLNAQFISLSLRRKPALYKKKKEESTVKARIQGIEAVCLVSDNRHLYITCEVLLFIKTIYLFNSHPGRPCNGAHANLTHI